jgi:hypothetical protein
MADNKVLFTLELQQKGNQISVVRKQTDQLAKSTSNVETAERKRNKTANTTYSRQKQGIIQTANSTKNFSKLSQSIDGGGGGPGGLVRAYALLAANVFALSAAFGVFSRAAQVDTLVESMRQLEIVSGKSIMSVARDLQEATGFGMDFAEAMRATSLALSAGFDSSQISALGEVARNAAVSLGRNLPDALDRIFRGVIKVEPELLDEIGLFVRVNDASAKYAATIGKSVGDLTEFEKRQAFLNEALDQGTSKFAAFAEVENDPFALLATTFSDISQAVLSFLNGAIGPAVKFLAENKAIFSTVFGAVAFTLLKMAIPAMGAFTNSLAVQAATAKESIDKQNRANKQRAQLSRNQHKEFLQQEAEKKAALADTARATSQGGPQAKLAVRGKDAKGRSASGQLEKALKKELQGRARLQVVEQRISDLRTKQGFTQRMKNEDAKQELRLLEAESVVLKDQLATETAIAGVKDMSGIDEGSLQQLETTKLSKKAIMAEGLAKVVNTAQTKGFSAAQAQLSVQLKISEAELKKEGITLTFLDKLMFKVTGTAANLGVAFQTMMAKVMPFITAILMALPLLQFLARKIGFASEQAETLKKKTKAATEAFDLLNPRIDHLNKQFQKADKSSKDFNVGMEAFNETILSSAKALQEQEEAFETWKESTNSFVYFIAEVLPAQVGFGTRAAIEAQREALVNGLDKIEYELSPKMKKLKRSFSIASFAQGTQEFLFGKSLNDTTDEIEALVKQINIETEATNNLRSAINGATDSARAFTNAFLVSTDFDKPLASLNQVIAALNETQTVQTGGFLGMFTKEAEELVLTDEQRLSYAKELSKNGAIRAILSQEENEALKESIKTGKDFDSLLQKVADRFFQMQELTIRMKSNMADLVDFQKFLAESAKASGTAAAAQLDVEKQITELKIKQLQMNVDNTKSQTNLTEEQLRSFSTMDSLLPLVEDELLKKEQLSSVMAAIHNLRILDNMVLEQQIENSTRLVRQDLARAKVAMTNLQLEEKIIKEKSKQLQLQASIEKLSTTGENLTGAEELELMIRVDDLQRETMSNKEKLEIRIAQLQFSVLKTQNEFMIKKTRSEKMSLLREYSALGGRQDEEARKRRAEIKTQLKDLKEITDLYTNANADITKQSVLTTTAITETFRTGFLEYLDAVLRKTKELLPGVTEDPFDFTRNRQDLTASNASIDDAFDKRQKNIDESDLSPKRKDDESKKNTELMEAAKMNVAINMMETNLLQFADNITEIFGDDGVFVSALATASANILNLGQNFGAEFEKAETTAGKVAVATGAAASAIGNMISLSAAQAKQQTGEIDKLIEAEEKRDGKSAASVAKIKALEAKKEAIKRKAFESNKKMMLAQAIMSTASGIASAMAGPPGMPWSAAFVAAAAAMGAMQIKLIKGMTYSGGGGETPKAGATNLTLGGGRSNRVNLAKQATEGELSYLRNQRGVGTTANNFTPSAASGMKNYSTGMPIQVGEQGPEIITPPVDIIPNEDIGRMGTTNINFSINAVDGQSVQNMLNDQQGNIIQMIRQAANENGTDFLPTVDTSVYGSLAK